MDFQTIHVLVSCMGGAYACEGFVTAGPEAEPPEALGFLGF